MSSEDDDVDECCDCATCTAKSGYRERIAFCAVCSGAFLMPLAAGNVFAGLFEQGHCSKKTIRKCAACRDAGWRAHRGSPCCVDVLSLPGDVSEDLDAEVQRANHAIGVATASQIERIKKIDDELGEYDQREQSRKKKYQAERTKLINREERQEVRSPTSPPCARWHSCRQLIEAPAPRPHTSARFSGATATRHSGRGAWGGSARRSTSRSPSWTSKRWRPRSGERFSAPCALPAILILSARSAPAHAHAACCHLTAAARTWAHRARGAPSRTGHTRATLREEKERLASGLRHNIGVKRGLLSCAAVDDEAEAEELLVNALSRLWEWSPICAMIAPASDLVRDLGLASAELTFPMADERFGLLPCELAELGGQASLAQRVHDVRALVGMLCTPSTMLDAAWASGYASSPASSLLLDLAQALAKQRSLEEPLRASTSARLHLQVLLGECIDGKDGLCLGNKPDVVPALFGQLVPLWAMALNRQPAHVLVPLLVSEVLPPLFQILRADADAARRMCAKTRPLLDIVRDIVERRIAALVGWREETQGKAELLISTTPGARCSCMQLLLRAIAQAVRYVRRSVEFDWMAGGVGREYAGTERWSTDAASAQIALARQATESMRTTCAAVARPMMRSLYALVRDVELSPPHVTQLVRACLEARDYEHALLLSATAVESYEGLVERGTALVGLLALLKIMLPASLCEELPASQRQPLQPPAAEAERASGDAHGAGVRAGGGLSAARLLPLLRQLLVHSCAWSARESFGATPDLDLESKLVTGLASQVANNLCTPLVGGLGAWKEGQRLRQLLNNLLLGADKYLHTLVDMLAPFAPAGALRLDGGASECAEQHATSDADAVAPPAGASSSPGPASARPVRGGGASEREWTVEVPVSAEGCLDEEAAVQYMNVLAHLFTDSPRFFFEEEAASTPEGPSEGARVVKLMALASDQAFDRVRGGVDQLVRWARSMEKAARHEHAHSHPRPDSSRSAFTYVHRSCMRQGMTALRLLDTMHREPGSLMRELAPPAEALEPLHTMATAYAMRAARVCAAETLQLLETMQRVLHAMRVRDAQIDEDALEREAAPTPPPHPPSGARRKPTAASRRRWKQRVARAHAEEAAQAERAAAEAERARAQHEAWRAEREERERQEAAERVAAADAALYAAALGSRRTLARPAAEPEAGPGIASSAAGASGAASAESLEASSRHAGPRSPSHPSPEAEQAWEAAAEDGRSFPSPPHARQMAPRRAQPQQQQLQPSQPQPQQQWQELPQAEGTPEQAAPKLQPKLPTRRWTPDMAPLGRNVPRRLQFGAMAPRAATPTPAFDATCLSPPPASSQPRGPSAAAHDVPTEPNGVVPAACWHSPPASPLVQSTPFALPVPTAMLPQAEHWAEGSSPPPSLSPCDTAAMPEPVPDARAFGAAPCCVPEAELTPYPPGLGAHAEQLRTGLIIQQVEYYFSDANLGRDCFLRGLMDAHGWVPAHIVVGFNRMRALGATVEQVQLALRFSSLVEVGVHTASGMPAFRSHANWHVWAKAADHVGGAINS